MRRGIIVTRSGDQSRIHRYKDNAIFALKGSETLFDEEIKYEIIDDKSLNDIRDDELLEIKLAIDFVFRKGYDEISVLYSASKSVFSMLAMISLFKMFSHIKLEIVDKNEAITFYKEGTHIITKKIYDEFILFSSKSAIITLEHFEEKVKHYLLDNKNPYLKGVTISNRIGVLTVEKGELFLIKKEDKKDA